MSSMATEPPTLRLIPFTGAATASPHVAANRRSYSCYNCNFSFHIIPTAATSTTSASSPSSFRCPSCHHRHLIPYHTVLPTPPPPPPETPAVSSDYVPSIFAYQTSDDSDSDYEYESENSLLSFSPPDVNQSTPALKSFVDSLPIKLFSPNSTPSPQSCSICMEDLGINSVAVNELPCQHYFHKDCIVEWLQRSNTCPLCRHKLPVDSSPEQGIEDNNEVLVVNLAPIREPILRRVSAENSLSSIAASSGSGSDRRVMNAIGETTFRRVSAENSMSSIAASSGSARRVMYAIREPILRRVSAENSLSSIAASSGSGSDQRVMNAIRETTFRGVSAENSMSSIAASSGSDRRVMNALREPFLRRVTAENSRSSIAASSGSGSDRRVMNANDGERIAVDFDAMHDEDGDTLMVDA